MKKLSKHVLLILVVLLVYCQENDTKKIIYTDSKNIINKDEVLLMIENLLKYDDTNMGLNAIFYASENYTFINLEDLNSLILESHSGAKKMSLYQDKDSVFFVKYLSMYLKDKFNKNTIVKRNRNLYLSDIWLTTDTIIFYIGKQNVGITEFYFRRKDLTIIKDSQIIFF